MNDVYAAQIVRALNAMVQQLGAIENRLKRVEDEIGRLRRGR